MTLALAWLHESSNQCHQYPRTMLAKYEWDRSYNAITWLYLFPIDYYDLCIKIYASVARVHTTSWSIYFDSTHHEWLMSPAKQFQVAMVCVTKLDTYSCSMCSWTFSQIVVSVRHSWWYIWHQDWWHGSFIVGGKWPTYNLNWLDRRNTIYRTPTQMDVGQQIQYCVYSVRGCRWRRVQVDINPDSMQVEMLNRRSYFGCDDECWKWWILRCISTSPNWLIWSIESCQVVAWRWKKWWPMSSKVTIDTWQNGV